MNSKFFLSLMLVFGLLLTSGRVHAADFKTEKVENPFSPGKGPIISGILVTTLGGGAGSFLFLVGLMERFPPLQGIGLGVVALSVGAGVPLIVYGARQRSQWKKFEASQAEIDQYITRKITKIPEHFGQGTNLEKRSMSVPVLGFNL